MEYSIPAWWVTAPSVIYITIPNFGLGPNPWPTPAPPTSPTSTYQVFLAVVDPLKPRREFGSSVLGSGSSCNSPHLSGGEQKRHQNLIPVFKSPQSLLPPLPIPHTKLSPPTPLSLYHPFPPHCLDSKSSASELQQNNGGSGIQGFPVNRWIKVNKVQSHCHMCGVQ